MTLLPNTCMYSTSMVESIVDYAKDKNAVPMSDKFVTTRSRQRRRRTTTEGCWKFLVLFKDGDEKWVPLKLLKETNPIEIAEFATA